MKKTILLIVAVLAVAAVSVWSGQRVRLIDVDSATTPAATSLRSVTNLTTATTITNTITGLTCLLTNVVGSTTNVFTIVTNIQGIAVGTGFANIAQANQVISNNVIIYQLLQSY